MYDYYSLVPKTMKENIKFRQELCRMGESSKKDADELWIMCSRDILFWINAFVCTYDPRLDRSSTVVPFITYDYQDDAILEIQKAIGNYDLLVKKSRDMGASWIFLMCYFHPFLFGNNLQFGMVSRNEDYVDKIGFRKSLFWKLDFVYERLPKFLRSPIERKKLYMENLEMGNVILGESTTGEIFRGDRATSVFMDELAAFQADEGFRAHGSVQYVTNSILSNSTFSKKGGANVFHEQAARTDSDIKIISMHWSLHPEKKKGLYAADKGKIKIIDKSYSFPSNYDFIADGRYPLRSPYFDKECKRASDPMSINAELEMNPEGAASQFFDTLKLREIGEKDIRFPFYEGVLEFRADNAQPIGFADRKDGLLKLWCPLDVMRMPPQNRHYVIGADIGMGSGGVMTSNSALAIIDAHIREKVGEFASPNIPPSDFARLAVALCRWFNGAYLIWEANGGAGSMFGREVQNLKYFNFYYRRQEKKVGREHTEEPGWWSNSDSKPMLLGEFRRALCAGEFTEHSREVFKECEKYIYSPDGKITHSGSLNTLDPSGARENHGDRVIADALAWHGTKEYHYSEDKEHRSSAGQCLQYRRELRNKMDRQHENDRATILY